MNEEFSFELTPWEAALDTMHPGDTMDALHFLTLLEAESDDMAAEALQDLEQKHIALDISNLPRDTGAGEAARRLDWEKKLADQGKLLENLPENDPLGLYLQELAAIPVAGGQEVYLQKYLAGDQQAAEQLANGMLSYVVEEAMHCAGRGVLLLDLIQEGSLGLWQGILGYREGDFTEHCLWYIRQRLSSAVLMQMRSSGLGRKLRQGMEQYLNADKVLLMELGRNATLEEIALKMHITPEEAGVYEKMMENARLRQQLEAAVSPKEPTPEDELPVEDTAYFHSRQRVVEMLSTLGREEARVVTMRFGLEGGMPMSPQEVGEKMNMTADQVVAMEASALKKLRQEQ